MNKIQSSTVRVLKPEEVLEAKHNACFDFLRSLEGSGLTVTEEAREKWWGK